MSGRDAFKFSLKRSDSTDGSRKESGSEFHIVGPASEKARVHATSTATKPWNIQFATAGRTEMLAVGNFGDWHAAFGEVLWSAVPKTPMNRHGKLVLHPL